MGTWDFRCCSPVCHHGFAANGSRSGRLYFISALLMLESICITSTTMAGGRWLYLNWGRTIKIPNNLCRRFLTLGTHFYLAHWLRFWTHSDVDWFCKSKYEEMGWIAWNLFNGWDLSRNVHCCGHKNFPLLYTSSCGCRLLKRLASHFFFFG